MTRRRIRRTRRREEEECTRQLKEKLTEERIIDKMRKLSVMENGEELWEKQAREAEEKMMKRDAVLIQKGTEMEERMEQEEGPRWMTKLHKKSTANVYTNGQ